MRVVPDRDGRRADGQVAPPTERRRDRRPGPTGRVRGARRRGFSYRRWAIGVTLPSLFLSSAYYYNNFAMLGLEPPPPGYRWVRYGPDLLMVEVFTGRIVDVIYGAFY
jgi:Ni/Co efflux regulator RcnB